MEGKKAHLPVDHSLQSLFGQLEESRRTTLGVCMAGGSVVEELILHTYPKIKKVTHNKNDGERLGGHNF
jgi:hypothetical protein